MAPGASAPAPGMPLWRPSAEWRELLRAPQWHTKNANPEHSRAAPFCSPVQAMQPHPWPPPAPAPRVVGGGAAGAPPHAARHLVAQVDVPRLQVQAPQELRVAAPPGRPPTEGGMGGAAGRAAAGSASACPPARVGLPVQGGWAASPLEPWQSQHRLGGRLG